MPIEFEKIINKQLSFNSFIIHALEYSDLLTLASVEDEMTES